MDSGYRGRAGGEFVCYAAVVCRVGHGMYRYDFAMENKERTLLYRDLKLNRGGSCRLMKFFTDQMPWCITFRHDVIALS